MHPRSLRWLFPAAALSLAAMSWGQAPRQVFLERFGGPRYDQVSSLIRTADRGIALCGFTQSFGRSTRCLWLLKLNPAGDTLWTRWLDAPGGVGESGGFVVRELADRGLAVAGIRDFGDPGGVNLWLLRMNARGDTLWTRTLDGGDGYDDECNAMETTRDRGYVLAGTTYSSATRYQMVAARLDSSGTLKWVRQFGGEWQEGCRSVAPTPDGGFVLAGYLNSFGNGGYDGYLVRLNGAGDTLWTRAYGGAEDDSFTCVRVTRDSGLVVAGITASAGDTGGDAWLLRMSARGDTLWSRTYGGIRPNGALAVRELSDRGFAFAGFTADSGNVRRAWLVRTNPAGEMSWARALSAGLSATACDLFPLSDTSLLLTGTANWKLDEPDAWVAQVGGDTSRLAVRPPSRRSPVPGTGLQRPGTVRLRVYDCRGTLVRETRFGALQPGYRLLPVNQPALAAGTYLCTARTPEAHSWMRLRVVR